MIKNSAKFFLFFFLFLFAENSSLTVSLNKVKEEAKNTKSTIAESPGFFCAGTDYRFAFGKEEHTISLSSNLKKDSKKYFSCLASKNTIQLFNHNFRTDFLQVGNGSHFFIYILFRQLLL